MGKSLRLFAVAALAGSLLVVGAPAQAVGGSGGATVVTEMNGSEEVPGPGDLNGWGWFTAKIHPRRGSLCFATGVFDIQLPVAGAPAHIHSGADGVAGPVVVDLGKVVKYGDPEGYADTCLYGLSKPLLTDIANNPWNYYVNVHNNHFPGGAIRGQLGYDV